MHTPDSPSGLPAVGDRAVLNAIGTAIIVTDLAGTITDCNTAVERIYGWRRDEIVGRAVLDLLVLPGDRGVAREIMTTVSRGQSWTGDIAVRRRDGAVVRAWVTDTPLYDEHGRVVGIVGLSTDVTEERVAEAMAADWERRLRLALAAGGMGTWRWDAVTGLATLDERMEQLLGLAPGEYDGTFDAWVALLHPEDRDAVLGEIRRAMAEADTFQVQHRVVWPDGSVHWLEGMGQVTVNDEGRATGSIGCAHDVTDRAQLRVRPAHERAAGVQRLRRLAEAVGRAGSVEAVLEAVRRQLEDGLPAVSGALSLLGVDGRRLRWEASFGYTTDVAELVGHIPVTAELPLAITTRTGRELHLAAHEMRERFPALAELNALHGARRFACLPLSIARRPLGALLLGLADGAPLAPDDAAFLSAVAVEVATAVDRLRGRTRLRSLVARVGDEPLPAQLPRVDGLELAAARAPSSEADPVPGEPPLGQWCDVVALPERRVALAVGTVTTPAAGAAARLRTAARAYAALDPSPAAVVGALDAFVTEELPDGLATVAYVLLDGLTGRAWVADAGHQPPLVQPADGAPVTAVAEPAAPLGLARDRRGERELPLRPGDTLVLCSTGLADYDDPAHDGEPDPLTAAVARLQPSGSLGAALQGAVAWLSAEHHPTPAVALLAARRHAG